MPCVIQYGDMNFREILHTTVQHVKAAFGRDGLLFVFFLVVSVIFWFMLTVNDEAVKEFHIGVEVTDVPEGITLINEPPKQISVMVRDRGTSFLKYVFKSDPVISLNFEDFQKTNNLFSVSRNELLTYIRNTVGANASIISINPDSIRATYTTLPPRKVKLIVNTDVTPSNECVLSGRIKSSVDSVWVYSMSPLAADFDRVETQLVYASGLKDTAVYKTHVKPIAGMRFVPSDVEITVPVEPLIRKQSSVPLVVDNLPENVNLITFPSTININYLIPMSMYKRVFANIKAHVDYNMLVDANTTEKLPVMVFPVPELVRDLSFSPDSVEYLIETR
ncbi:MAG: hypothetical protein IK120_10365 [Muribaculaceae bacterium]|nr:hypothetical protein [Muribaculaceae bacterium]